MSAWTQNAPDERWYRLDMTHGSYNAVRAAMGAKHRASPRAGLLSVYENTAGTESVAKVADAGAWSPPPAAVVETYTADTLQSLQDLMASTLWRRVSRP